MLRSILSKGSPFLQFNLRKYQIPLSTYQYNQGILLTNPSNCFGPKFNMFSTSKSKKKKSSKKPYTSD